ncbi:transporter [Candidatus Levyibacteriota bacterium]|nr:transporter [Candidatus Levybacteria bacterium]
MKSNHTLALVALTIASIIWGATSSIMKLTLEIVPLFSLGAIRFCIAAIILLPFAITNLHIKRKHILLLIFSAFCGITLHISIFFWGLTLTSAINSSIITATIPLFTIFIAHRFLRESLKMNILFGAILGLFGILIIIGKDIIQGINLSPTGDFLLLFSTFLFILYEIMSKELFANYKPIPITFYGFVIGGISFLPGALLDWQRNPLWISAVRTEHIFGILFGIIFSSVLAYSLWQWGLSQLTASRVGFFFYINPIVGTITAVLLLNEQITPIFIVGAIFIFAGLLLAEGTFNFYPFKKTLKSQ